MKKLEQYLDQVCQSIGGPWELRAHVRQEMREHLLDAVVQHKAAGMTDEQALDKALHEFGKPDEVRSDLEATHGQRMTWIIDKTLQWKEMTMKAKWLWTTWAYLAAALVVALDAMFIAFNVVFLVPKFFRIMDEMVDPDNFEKDGVTWMVNFLRDLSYVYEHYTTYIALGVIVVIGLFEWRVKSENKPFMRLSALGTAAVGLTVVVGLMGLAMVILFCLETPNMSRVTRPWALEQVADIDTAVSAIEKALAKKDWKGMEEKAEVASIALTRLSFVPALRSLASRNDGPGFDDLRSHVKGAQEILRDVRQAIAATDAERVQVEMAKFRKMLEPVRDTAKKLNR